MSLQEKARKLACASVGACLLASLACAQDAAPSWRERPAVVEMTDARLPGPYEGVLPEQPSTRTIVPWDSAAVLEVLPEGDPEAGALVVRLGKSDPVYSGRGGVLLKLEPPGARIEPISITWQPREGVELGALARVNGEVRQYEFSRDEAWRRTPKRSYSIPTLDLDLDATRQVVVDREAGQYLGHPTTVLLEDGTTILCVYPKGHGSGAIVYKRSDDGGRTWSERIPVPESWATSKEVPTIHRVIDPETGKRRLIVFSGLYPTRLAVSEDDGASWGELEPVGEWGGIVVMGDVVRLKDGRYLAMFHDDGRFIREDGGPRTMTLYKTFSEDGGLTWSDPEVVFADDSIHLCEPGIIRSPCGGKLAVLLRENRRLRNSHVIFSEDEGAHFSQPRELPASLSGDRHTEVYAPDGRLFISFRDTTLESPTQGDWVGWTGTWEDLEEGLEGQYRVRLKDNHHRWDCAYPGVEILPDGTIVTTTYGHWDEGHSPYILSVRLTLEELDQLAAAESNP